MKKVYFGLFAFICCLLTIQNMEGQNIYNGDVTLTTQTEVDTFGTNNYNQINGNVRIEGVSTSEITNLSSLSSLGIINGKLDLFNNENLLSLNGLENLTTISDWLIISNIGVADLLGLANLTSVNQLEIVNMPNLQSLNGLQNITSINWFVQISANPNLNSLNGLNNLVSTEATFSITLNHSLIDLQGLDSFTSVNNNYGFTVGNNNNLQSLDGISQLTTVGGVSVSNNGLLNDFCDLANLITNGMYTAYSVVNNDYNPTAQDIIDGNCSTQLPILEITYPKADDYYIEGRNLRLQIASNTALPENQQFDIEYSTDDGITWIADGSFNRDSSGGDFWLIPSVAEPVEFLVKLETNLSGNVIEILSNPFTVQPIDYYIGEGFSNSGVSQIEFTAKGGLNKWHQLFGSEAHNCLDDDSQDWGHNSIFFTCKKKIKTPFRAVIIGLKPEYEGDNCGLPTNDKGYGKQIVIQSLKDKTMAIRFAHLRNIKRTLKIGDTLEEYQKVGRIGGSGAEQAHLHISLYKNIYEWTYPYTDSQTGKQTNTAIELLMDSNSITDPAYQDCQLIADNFSAEFEFIPRKNNLSQNEIPVNIDFSNIDSSGVVTLFPNPASQERINIKNHSRIEIMRIEVFNISGEIVAETKFSEKSILINGLKNEIYFVKIYFLNGNEIVKKLIVKN